VFRGESDARLILGQLPVVDAGVAVWCPTDYDSLAREVLLVVVDLTSGRPSEDLELEFDRCVISVDIKVLRNVHLLLLAAVGVLIEVHLKVLVLRDQASLDDVDHDVSFTNIYQHVVLQ